MKLKRAVVVLMAVGLCMLTGCSNQSYVGKWTTTKLQGMEKEEKDFQKENGYQMILYLNANGKLLMDMAAVLCYGMANKKNRKKTVRHSIT